MITTRSRFAELSTKAAPHADEDRAPVGGVSMLLGGTCHAPRDDSSSRPSNLICLLDTEIGEDRAKAGVDRASRTSTVGDPLIVIAG